MPRLPQPHPQASAELRDSPPLRTRPTATALRVALVCALFGGASFAQGTTAAHDAGTSSEGPVRARLVAEQLALQPGTSTRLGVVFELDEGWHLYGPARNDSGLPVAIRLELPPGVRHDPPIWPVPTRLLSPGDLLDHVYERRVTALIPLSLPADWPAPGTLVLRAKLEWMVCRETCLLGEGEVVLRLPVLPAGSAPARSPDAQLFAETKARLALPWPQSAADSDHGTRGAAPPVTAQIQGDVLAIVAAHAEGLSFVPDEDCVRLLDLVERGAAVGDRLALRLSPERTREARVAGVVTVQRRGAPPLFFRLELPAPPAPARG